MNGMERQETLHPYSQRTDSPSTHRLVLRNPLEHQHVTSVQYGGFLVRPWCKWIGPGGVQGAVPGALLLMVLPG
jgi:hypothetical protein